MARTVCHSSLATRGACRKWINNTKLQYEAAIDPQGPWREMPVPPMDHDLRFTTSLGNLEADSSMELD